jgi:hypothetical protein
MNTHRECRRGVVPTTAQRIVAQDSCIEHKSRPSRNTMFTGGMALGVAIEQALHKSELSADAFGIAACLHA